MTDATSTANDHKWGAESARRADPDFDETSGSGDEAAGEAPRAPESGGATTRTGGPGVASPAGWFPSATGEAAPPVQPDTEPARLDAGNTGIQATDVSQPDVLAAGVPADDDLAAEIPSAVISTAGISSADIPGAGVTGIDTTATEVQDPGIADGGQAQPSHSEGPHSGRSRPSPEPDTLPEPPGPMTWAGPWLEPPGPAAWSRPQREFPALGTWAEPWREPPVTSGEDPPGAATRVAGVQDPSGSAAWAGPWQEPSETATRAMPVLSTGPATWAGPWQESHGPESKAAQRQESSGTRPARPEPWQARPGQPAAPHADPNFPVVGPTAALRGWAGGPGFAIPAAPAPQSESPPQGEPPLRDEPPLSGWQLAQGVWQESGISWERPADHEPVPGRGGYPRNASGAQSPQADGRRQVALPPSPHPEATVRPALPSMPLGAPTFADGLAPAAPQPRRPHPRAGEPDDLFQAWHRSVRKASARDQKTGRGYGRQVVRAGVPLVVIVTVGVGAVMMLTGKTNSVLTHHAEPGSPAPGWRGGAAIRGASGSLTAAGFSGYPGQRGSVLVDSIAAAGGTHLAVGSADGHPAIWRLAGSGGWQLVSAASPAVFRRPGVEKLTSVAHGPAGWIAVGGVVSGTAQQPVVLTSTDGMRWRTLDTAATFAGPNLFVNGATAGPGGYVVVGKQVSKGRVFVAMWWSTDLKHWVRGDNSHLDGRLKSSTAYAVAAVPVGFAAAGTHGDCHAIWTSPDGRNWRVHDIPAPKGAKSAMLSVLAVNGQHAAAAGYAVMKDGRVPIVVVSVDGGAHWHQIMLKAPGGLGAVTALTAAGSGFVAAGQAGPAGAQHPVTWHTRDILSWSAPISAGKGAERITALTDFGATVTGVLQHGTDPSTVTLPAP